MAAVMTARELTLRGRRRGPWTGPRSRCLRMARSWWTLPGSTLGQKANRASSMIQVHTYRPETILEEEQIRRWCMKFKLIVALLIGSYVPLYGQQQLCFSMNCPQTPATSFALDRSNTQLKNIFRPLPVLPAYTPVAPFALSPSTKQFFQYSAPNSAPTDADNRLGLASPGNATAMVETSHGGTIGTNVQSGLNGSHLAAPAFSTGQGGNGFSPTSPKF